MNHIELFSGCGGLSLGLKHNGFELVLANELSPMAAETFAYNLLDENLARMAEQQQKPQKTLWLNSQYQQLSERLKENPLHFPSYDGEGYDDLPAHWEDLKGKLLVGSIIELNRLLDHTPQLVDALQHGLTKNQSLDLVSGGPPCQSFSMAGLRKRDCDKNQLPWEFAQFVKYTRPKIALLENVTGILRAFKDTHGKKIYAWYEVAKAFACIDYVPICLHINARHVGVAQNRPRYIMIAIRHDHLMKIQSHLQNQAANQQLFEHGLNFYRKVKQHGEQLEFGHLNYFDTNRPADHKLFSESFLSNLVGQTAISVQQAIDDLKNQPEPASKFVQHLNQTFSFLKKSPKLENHQYRNNSDKVQRRFRIYQVLNDIQDPAIKSEIQDVLKGKQKELSLEAWLTCQSFHFLNEDGQSIQFKTKEDFVTFLQQHATKKQTQKALIAQEPAPTALSIPDDACHYDPQELRVLTVREMARIQSFPDNFVFRSKVTTGGQMRKFQVPQYTQVGNAIPPLLGVALGHTLKILL